MFGMRWTKANHCVYRLWSISANLVCKIIHMHTDRHTVSGAIKQWLLKNDKLFNVMCLVLLQGSATPSINLYTVTPWNKTKLIISTAAMALTTTKSNIWFPSKTPFSHNAHCLVCRCNKCLGSCCFDVVIVLVLWCNIVTYLWNNGWYSNTKWKSFSEHTSRSRWWTAHLKLRDRLPLICKIEWKKELLTKFQWETFNYSLEWVGVLATYGSSIFAISLVFVIF